MRSLNLNVNAARDFGGPMSLEAKRRLMESLATGEPLDTNAVEALRRKAAAQKKLKTVAIAASIVGSVLGIVTAYLYMTKE